MSDCEDWLKREDDSCFSCRLERLNWLVKIHPNAQLVLSGGLTNYYLYEECKYCFVYAQFFAVVVLGLAFIEKTLAAWFYVEGRNDLKSVSVSRLLGEAKDAKWLSEYEYKKLNEIRLLRNPIAHFRPPLAADTIECRASQMEEDHYSVIEQDARDVIQAMVHIILRRESI